MSARHILLVVLLLVAEQAYGKPQEVPQNTNRFLIDVAKNVIQKCIQIVENIVNAQLEKIRIIRQQIADITNKAIETAKEAINTVIDDTLGTIRKIAQNAIDAGINTTECYVVNVDNLNQLRRELILNEVMCAANEMTAFTNIIDAAVNNFTSDLAAVASFPKRLQGCILNITAIKCVTEVINDVTDLQKAIPQQIIGWMMDITDYFTGFVPTVHECEFRVLREAVAGCREVIDHMTKCIRDPEHNHQSIIKPPTPQEKL